ncbi:hypothetical protein QF046_002374 [Microbacterium sp. W4I4]|uniref:HAAS signaling domain-containing protein n=1 Tax=Microbacterium sp. W4I4 TaxID=3042295 RepID=UPI00278A00C7|nr:DUF1700 domain-containing protein [Microbacterium sp. W4I4]MDQ0614733.1 hypothetical protein [Microbacterium sp. W4I4]
MTTEDDYLRSVERMLRGIAPEHRTAVLDDLRGHFADAEDAGRPVDEIVRGLGTPQEIADRAVEEFGADAVAGDGRAESAWRVLQGAAVVVAVVIGVVVAFMMPSYTGFVDTVSSDGTRTQVDTTQTLVEVNGLWVALIALVPALVALVPMVVPRRARTATASVAAAVLTLMALVGGFSLGGFFLPTVMLSWAALIVWVRLRGSGFGLTWRIVGGVLAALPVLGFLLPVFGGMPGRYADGAAGSDFQLSAWAWPFFAAILVLAVLIAIGYRSAGWLLAALGLLMLAWALVSGELFALLVIWLGGLWLTIGLAHAVTASRRP